MQKTTTITCADSFLEFLVLGRGSSGASDGDGRFEVITSGMSSSVVSLQVQVGETWVTTDTITQDGLYTATSVCSRNWRVGCATGDYAEDVYIEVAQ